MFPAFQIINPKLVLYCEECLESHFPKSLQASPPLLSYRTGPLHLNTHFISPQSVPLEAILVPTRRGSTFWQIWNSNKAAAATKKGKHADGNLLEMLKLSLGKHSTWHTGIHFTLAGWLWRGGAFVALTPSAHLHCILQLFQIFWNTKLYAVLGCKITVYLEKKNQLTLLGGKCMQPRVVQ